MRVLHRVADGAAAAAAAAAFWERHLGELRRDVYHIC